MSNLGYGYMPTHPGELLKEEIAYRNISRTSLAKQMGISSSALGAMLNEKRPLTADTAILFEAALGISADLLMRMQLKYNMQKVREDKTLAKRLEVIRSYSAML
jgi:addiction module HigA family antidote